MDNREIGIRVGAAANQAASVIAGRNDIDITDVEAFHLDLTRAFLRNMGTVQDEQTGTVAAVAPVAPVRPITPAQQAPQATQPLQAAQANLEAALGATAVMEKDYGYDLTPSGSNRPLNVSDPRVPDFVRAQAAAVGCTEVWDNRGKPKFIAAIQAGKDRTPPPFRSATEGVDQGFWPADR